MTQMTDDELKALTDGEMRQALGYYSGKLGAQRLKAMVYYLGEAKGDLSPSEVEGRSAVVSPDVRNVIESMLPQLMVKFCGGDEVVTFEAQKPGDEQAAEQATDYINHLFYARNDGERLAYVWMKDALLSKNGIIKAWWDERTEETREEYKALSDVELAQLMDDDEIEVTEQRASPDEDDAEQRQQAMQQMGQQLQQAMQAAQQNPQAAQAVQQIQQQMQQLQAQPPKQVFDVVCKRVKPGGKICIENVPPEEFLISRNAKNLETARFIGHRIQRTASELESLGYKNVDQISSDGSSVGMNMERIERLQFDDEMSYNSSDQMATADQSQRIIWVTECWIRCDYDGDGIAELRRVLRAGDRILENEIVDVVPFVSITPIPMPHKFFGLSVADLALEGQRIKTSILRGMLDNMYLQINGRYFAVDGQVNLDDLLASRPGGVVRIKQAGAAGRLDQGGGDAANAMGMMEYMSGYLEDSTGWTRYNQGSDGDSLNQTATGVNQITNRADMRLDLIARNFATGFRELFRLMLKLVSQQSSKEDIVKLRGQWVTVNPRDWRNGFETSINVGLGTGNKDQQVNHLLLLNQKQADGLAIGVASPENIFNGLSELTKAMGFKSSAKFFTDPAQQQGQRPDPAAAKQQAEAQIEQAKLQGQMQIAQMQAQLKQKGDADAKQAEIGLERERMQMQAQVDTHRQQVEAQQKALEMQGAKEIDQAKFAAQMQLEQFKAQMQRETAIAVAKINAEAMIMRAQLQASATPAVATPAQDMAADAVVDDADDNNA
jgi:hypothetical protein